MKKTTLYLPDDLKAALERLAAERGSSEATIVREALQRLLAERQRPRPRVPLTGRGLGDASIAERTDELLAGFGQG
ncbi:MAG: ribbon-helix-helix protein, CopG family [Acidobacteria bacterium]|nr:MAG: ribbon-helix-helix protein, CopG family [Acidobacteriota bacterium]REK09809.1 MAG: ribbon-helix-helix protein, CopG family [Acidobacteriota bacterium]